MSVIELKRSEDDEDVDKLFAFCVVVWQVFLGQLVEGRRKRR